MLGGVEWGVVWCGGVGCGGVGWGGVGWGGVGWGGVGWGGVGLLFTGGTIRAVSGICHNPLVCCVLCD